MAEEPTENPAEPAKPRTRRPRTKKAAPAPDDSAESEAPPRRLPPPEPIPAPEPVAEPVDTTPIFTTSAIPQPPPGAAMPTDPTPPPAPTNPTPVPEAPPRQWLSVPAPPPAAPAPAPVPAPEPMRAIVPEPPRHDDRLRSATHRNGSPSLVALGMLITTLGMLLFVYTYYAGNRDGRLPEPAGIRADYIGALLVVLGLVLVFVFLFAPRGREFGLSPMASRDELQSEARLSAGALRTGQTLVGIGVVLMMIGLVWIVYWLYIAYRNINVRQTSLGGYSIPTHYLGAVLLVAGLLMAFYFWGTVGAARRRRNLAIVALLREPGERVGAAAGSGALSSGVSEKEVQDLMRRLDGLMAQLPDAAVTEFSKTAEADTYLKLLGP